MELRHLEYLHTVVEERSFTRAAARLHIAQPGISAQIRQLERELGQQLLDRSNGTVRPTQAGAAVLVHARAALAAVAAARVAADEVAGLLRGRVSIGMLIACGIVEVPAILAAFHREHPGVEITLQEAGSAELLESVRTGALDLAWVGTAGSLPAGIAAETIIDEPLVVAVGHAHPLAGRRSMRLASLGTRPLITLPRGTGVRAAFDAGCAGIGYEPDVALEANSPAVVAELAIRGLGAAVLPSSVAAQHRELHAILLTAPRLRSRIELVWRTQGHVSPAAQALVVHARAQVRRKSA